MSSYIQLVEQSIDRAATQQRQIDALIAERDALKAGMKEQCESCELKLVVDSDRYFAEQCKAERDALRAELNKGIDAYLAQPACCSGHECGCGGVTVGQNIVGMEMVTKLSNLESERDALREALTELYTTSSLLRVRIQQSAPAVCRYSDYTKHSEAMGRTDRVLYPHAERNTQPDQGGKAE